MLTMDALRTLTETLPGFPGYGREDDRRLSDELVRAYIGEALVTVAERLSPQVASQTPIDELLLRCEFRNQVAFKAFEYADLDEETIEQTARYDVRLVELAQRVSTLEPAATGRFLAEVKIAFDERDHAMQALPA